MAKIMNAYHAFLSLNCFVMHQHELTDVLNQVHTLLLKPLEDRINSYESHSSVDMMAILSLFQTFDATALTVHQCDSVGGPVCG